MIEVEIVRSDSVAMRYFKVSIQKEYPEYPKLVKITIQGKHFSVSLLNYGGTISELCTVNRLGQQENIVLRYQQESEYLMKRSFIGAAVGRVAGRISQGLWQSDLGTFQLEKNENGTTHLHGGLVGFDTIFWHYQIIEKSDYVQVVFSRDFLDNLGGYPGNLAMTLCYTVFENQKISITYEGISDQTTIINPTNHSYFNLSGNLSKRISDHILTLDASNYLPLKQDKTPTGGILSVAETPFDFRSGKLLEETLLAVDDQIVQESGLNHSFLLDKELNFDAMLYHPESGRGIKIRTTNSAIVCYSGNHFAGAPFNRHCGLALETQELPDAINHPAFGSIVVDANQPFYQKTEFEFFSSDVRL